MINRQNSSAFEPRTRAVQKFSDNLSQKDRRDPFRITIGSRSSLNATLGGIKSGANVDLKLLNRSGQVIASSKNKGNKRERIQVGSLEQGVYRLVAELKGKVATKFNLRATTTAIATPNPNPNPIPNPSPSPLPNPNPSPSPLPNPNPSPSPLPNPNPSPSPNPVPTPTPAPTDLAPNTAPTARVLTLSGTSADFEDFVGAVDTTDFYKFTIGATNPTAKLTGSITGKSGALAGTVKVNLFGSDGTTLIETKDVSGVNASLFDNKLLAAGDYFLEVQSPTTDVDYKLSLASDSIADNGGDAGSPKSVTVGTNPSVTTEFDFVGPGDTTDAFAFNNDTDQVIEMKLTRADGGALNSDVKLFLFNPDGSIREELSAATSSDPNEFKIVRDVTAIGAGENYTIQVENGGDTSTDYKLEYFFL